MKFRNVELHRFCPQNDKGGRDHFCRLFVEFGKTGKLYAQTANFKTHKGAVNAINKLAKQLGIKEQVK